MTTATCSARMMVFAAPLAISSFDAGRQPRYHKMNTRRKKQFVWAMVHHGNVDEFNDMLNDMKREAENKK